MSPLVYSSSDDEDVPLAQKKALLEVKKEYALPGQTRDTPEEGDPLRKFYTSLLEQRPESEMARKWCVMNGLLSAEDAQAYVNAVAARKGDSRPASRAGNGAKATPAKRAAPKSAAGAKKTKGAAAAKKGAAKATPKGSAKGAATKTAAAKRASPGGSGKKPAAAKKATPASKAKVKREASPDWDDDGSDDEIIPAKKTRVSYY
ncbi:hypothetical protein QBZ16_001202 [Prototheca wickerhamii]|uniref:Uncharacterized protein n=1 Tax=Prototheca wickerhamii TaxID=3111 RepID=A0AAD9IFL7_PROWI|nr:hypothetical protein QBZ16_001202 [Prototheca wickerhamii]